MLQETRAKVPKCTHFIHEKTHYSSTIYPLCTVRISGHLNHPGNQLEEATEELN
jgi:hypothetical protein